MGFADHAGADVGHSSNVFLFTRTDGRGICKDG